MKPKAALSLFLAGVMLMLTSCGPVIPEPGKWISGQEDFGEFSFFVSDDNKSLSSIELTLVDWSCEEVLVNTIVGFTGGDGVYQIEEGGFEVQLTLLIMTGTSIFDLRQNGTLTLEGTFDNKAEASGSWEFRLLDPPVECSGDWTATH